jgi:hypothetical protein
MTGRGDPGRRARDPLSSAEERLLRDFRRLTPKVRAEVGRLVRASAGLTRRNTSRRGGSIYPRLHAGASGSSRRSASRCFPSCRQGSTCFSEANTCFERPSDRSTVGVTTLGMSRRRRCISKSSPKRGRKQRKRGETPKVSDFIATALYFTRENDMTRLLTKYSAGLYLMVCLPGFAAADAANRCTDDILSGQYVFTASGFTRPPDSAPGTPWVPKAIVEVLQFNGDGTLSTPAVTVANPFGDTGAILQPPSGAAGSYSIGEDCTGTLQFQDAAGVTFRIYVDPPLGDTIYMIQINPNNNVFQGSARRVW